MRSIDAVLVDFDGTACLHDVAEHLLGEFADPSWSDLDVAWERGEIGGRDALSIQAAMLAAPLEEMIRFATDHCPLDPTFGRFVSWARERDVPVTLVSDGFGFYIEPLLRANRLAGMDVVTNGWGESAGPTFGYGHPSCVGCGTCKKQAAERARDAHGRVAFVGEGTSDRFGARYADVTLAKRGESLVPHREAESIPYVPWSTFDDIRSWLEGAGPLPGLVGGEPCPGWRDPP